MLKADAQALRNLGKALRKSRPDVYRATQKGMRIVGRRVADRAKENASWSTRIPGTVKVRTAGVAAVIVQAGGASAPHAKPLEHAGKEGTFRHPLNFPDQREAGKKWVSQTARPFLHPAALEHLDADAAEVGRVLQEQVDKIVDGEI